MYQLDKLFKFYVKYQQHSEEESGTSKKRVISKEQQLALG